MKTSRKTRDDVIDSREKTMERQLIAYDYSQQVGHLLRKAYQRHLAIFQTNSADQQLTSVQFSVLCAIFDHGSSSQADLVRTSAIDQATIRGILERLKQRNLVALESDENDRRKVIYSLTQKGRDLTVAMMPNGLKISEQTVRDLNPAERLALQFLLRKLVSDQIDGR
jgi:DNA-binding MarR family transcriptional regulator